MTGAIRISYSSYMSYLAYFNMYKDLEASIHYGQLSTNHRRVLNDVSKVQLNESFSSTARRVVFDLSKTRREVIHFQSQVQLRTFHGSLLTGLYNYAPDFYALHFVLGYKIRNMNESCKESFLNNRCSLCQMHMNMNNLFQTIGVSCQPQGTSLISYIINGTSN